MRQLIVSSFVRRIYWGHL